MTEYGEQLSAARFRAERDQARQEVKELREEMESMKPRLMPMGCEWPRYEDGEPVQFGDETNLTDAVESITFCDDGTTLIGDKHGDFDAKYVHGVKRPVKVLDADGVEIRVGDTVWDEHGDELVVLAVYGQDVHCRYAEYDDQICDNGVWEPSQLTHRATVLAADGRPLRERETVWSIFAGVECVIKRIDYERKGGEACVCVRFADMESLNWVRPDVLTHERPVADTWERLEEDATKLSPYYYARDVMGLDTDKMPPKESRRIDMMRDLVRRAKALAERDA